MATAGKQKFPLDGMDNNKGQTTCSLWVTRPAPDDHRRNSTNHNNASAGVEFGISRVAYQRNDQVLVPTATTAMFGNSSGTI